VVDKITTGLERFDDDLKMSLKLEKFLLKGLRKRIS
jgi:hypothetical protein